MAPRSKRTECVVCSGHVDDVGPLSKRGRCEACALKAVRESVTQMRAKKGERFERWQHGIAVAAGLVPAEGVGGSPPAQSKKSPAA